jgi:hypothetical protein
MYISSSAYTGKLHSRKRLKKQEKEEKLLKKTNKMQKRGNQRP